jgi:dihydrofolate reductase
MRKLIVSNMMSLDGFFEGPNKELDWHVADEEFFTYARDMLRAVDTILFGRVTYQLMANYWPSAPKDEIAEKMNALPKVVFSRTLQKVDWNDSKLVRGDLTDEVRKLKQSQGGNMVILGSASIASPLLEVGLIDEYRVILNPILLGSGKPLFAGIEKRISLKLLSTKGFASGVVLLNYQKV